uniref:DUF834 domain-containing protein n=1 Tax=Oryza glumipatula TaxID=40148 RepID=A0A0D9ZIG2_9ORYZ
MVVDWGSRAATRVALRAVVPAVRVEQRNGGSSSVSALPEDDGDAGSSTEDAIEGTTSSGSWGKWWRGALGRLESCPRRADLKREGKTATSARAAWLNRRFVWGSRRGERRPRPPHVRTRRKGARTAASWGATCAGGVAMAVAGRRRKKALTGWAPSAPPIGGRRERRVAK